MSFNKKIHIWKSYIINKALSTTKQVQFVDLKQFVITTLDVNNKTFVVYMTIWGQEKMPEYSKKQA